MNDTPNTQPARLLDCGFCYEEQGEEVHPHPGCPVGREPVPAGRDALPDRLEAALTARYTELGNPFSRMRIAFQGPDGWPASKEVGPHDVVLVLRELLAAAPAVLPPPADRAAVLLEVADFLRGLRVTGTRATAQNIETELREWAAALRSKADEAQQQTERLPSIHANDVQGFCPACGHGVLMLGDGGHVVCTLIDCPNPDAADELLRTHLPAVVAAVADEEPDTETPPALTPCTCRQAVHTREHKDQTVPGCPWCAPPLNIRPNQPAPARTVDLTLPAADADKEA